MIVSQNFKHVSALVVVYSAILMFLLSFVVGLFNIENGLSLNTWLVIIYAIPLLLIWPRSVIFAIGKSVVPLILWIVYLFWFTATINVGAGGLGLALILLWFIGLSVSSLILSISIALILKVKDKKKALIISLIFLAILLIIAITTLLVTWYF